MTVYYVDPTATGANDGSSLSDAWESLQEAIDSTNNAGKPAAGDTVMLCSAGTGNDEDITVAIDFDGITGTDIGTISWIGANSLGVDDGTRYVIDGAGGSSANLFTFDTSHYWYYFKNIELNNASAYGIKLAGPNYYPLAFENVVVHNATNDAVKDYGKGCLFYRCRFSSCSVGYTTPTTQTFYYCIFKDMTGDGVSNYFPFCAFIGCVFHNNGGDGIDSSNDPIQVVYNCVFDGNTGDGWNCNTGHDAYLGVFGNRFTNNTHGLYRNNSTVDTPFEDYNFYLGNSTAAKSGVMIEGDNSLSTGTEGYTNKAGDDFSLTSTATLRRVKVEIP